MKYLMKAIKYVVIPLVLIFLLFWLISIAKCEYLTVRYGYQFEDSYNKYTMLAAPDYFKLLEYSETKATVYYVKMGAGGDVLYFKKENNENDWTFVRWSTIWSSSGSADDFVWPYIR